MFAPGVLLAGRYELERFLGEGGMGSVWSARDNKLPRKFAVKLLRSAASKDSDPEEIRQERLRLLKEGRAVATVDHANVVKVHDVLDEGDTPCLVMELLEGRSLRQHLDEVGPLDPRTACALLVQVAKGLAAVHAQNIVHRDLKPANIFLQGKGEVSASTEVKVLDFGIAKVLHRPAPDLPEGADGEAPPQPTTAALENLTRQGDVLGSPCYMSPEQVKANAEVDHRTDIWSLGIVLYECLSGSDNLPTRGDDTDHVFKRIQNDRIPPIQEVVPDVPFRIAHLLGRMLAKDPAARPGSMAEVIDVLERVLAPAAVPQISASGPVPADSLDGLVLVTNRPQAVPPTTNEMEQHMEPAPRRRRPPARPALAVLGLLAGVGLVLLGATLEPPPLTTPAQRAGSALKPARSADTGAAPTAAPRPVISAGPVVPPPTAAPSTPSSPVVVEPRLVPPPPPKRADGQGMKAQDPGRPPDARDTEVVPPNEPGNGSGPTPSGNPTGGHAPPLEETPAKQNPLRDDEKPEQDARGRHVPAPAQSTGERAARPGRDQQP